ncbi:hypothetical protein D3C86_1879220 [compost metagenome]
MDTLGDPLRRAHRDRRLVHHQTGTLEAGAQLIGYRQHMGKIGGPVLATGCTDGDENDIGLLDALVDPRGEDQLATGELGLEHRVQAGFINGCLAAGQARQAEGVALDTRHLVAHFRETGRCHQPHITRTDNA